MNTKAKIVSTYDPLNNQNGYLMELDKDYDKTKAYLTVAYPGCFKGYHLHKVREANYVCVKGELKVILYTPAGREEYNLSAGDKLNIPINIPTGLLNESLDQEAWLINFPNPAYDPKLVDEQVDFTQDEVEKFMKENYG